MAAFKVDKLPNKDLVFDNTLFHNKGDFNQKDKLYLSINDKVSYCSVHNPITKKGFIGISEIMRNNLRVEPTDIIIVKEVLPKKNNLSKINIELTLASKVKGIVSCHEAEVTDNLLKSFVDHYFCNNQALLWKYGDKFVKLNITTSEEGYINKKTKINITSTDYILNLVGSKLLKRDLFKDDYNFESIGIGGLDNQLITIFRKALATRAIKTSIIEKLGIKHTKGLLLHGLPGCGKSLIARRIGSMISEIEPKLVNGPEIMNKYVGQSEENIRNLFQEAKADYDKNKENAGLHVIIFDEIDALCKTRGGSGVSGNVNDSILNQLLTMIDGVNQFNNFFIIGMTNRKDLLDEALLRSGRLEIHVEIKLPDLRGRQQIFNIHTNKMQTNNMIDKNVDINKLSQLTENYSGADIETIVRNSGTMAIHEKLASNQKDISESDIIIKMEHLLKSISEVTPLLGNTSIVIKSLIPDNYNHLSQSHTNCYNQIVNYIKKQQNLKTVLIYGRNKTGKTTLSAKIANDNKVKYTKLIRAIDMIGMDDTSKSYHISDIVTGSYVSEESLIVLDDIEIIMSFLAISNKITLSNKIYQTIITLLKTEPLKKSHTLTLIMTCGDKNCFELMNKFFDMTFCLEIN